MILQRRDATVAVIIMQIAVRREGGRPVEKEITRGGSRDAPCDVHSKISPLPFELFQVGGPRQVRIIIR